MLFLPVTSSLKPEASNNKNHRMFEPRQCIDCGTFFNISCHSCIHQLYVHKCVWVHTSMHTWRSEVNVGCLSFSLSILSSSLETQCLTMEITTWVECLAPFLALHMNPGSLNLGRIHREISQGLLIVIIEIDRLLFFTLFEVWDKDASKLIISGEERDSLFYWRILVLFLKV